MGTKYSIGPEAIGTPSVQGGPPLALAAPQWVKIQSYVADAKALPTTEELFRSALGAGAPSNLSDFKQLIDAYQSIDTHCQEWAPIFTAVVGLASSIYEYGMDKVPVYYPPILQQAQILEKEPENAQAKQALAAILQTLEKEATGYGTKASAVFGQVQKFAENASADQVTLVGTDGKSGLLEYYEEKYSSTSQAAAGLNRKIDTARQLLESTEAEYEHDVVVASTSPSYAWIWPEGTIAAAIVAGIYGHKAVEALREEERIRKEIETLGAEEAADGNLMTVIKFATSGVKTINEALAAALPVVQTVEGAWNAMASDLNAIAKLIETDIAEVPPIIMGLGVEAAMKAWHEVALAAENYRQSAFITEPTAEMHRWKLERYVLPPVPAAAPAA